MKWLSTALIVLMLFFTCCNVQALRDAYAPEPSPIEALTVKLISDLGGNE